MNRFLPVISDISDIRKEFYISNLTDDNSSFDDYPTSDAAQVHHSTPTHISDSHVENLNLNDPFPNHSFSSSYETRPTLINDVMWSAIRNDGKSSSVSEIMSNSSCDGRLVIDTSIESNPSHVKEADSLHHGTLNQQVFLSSSKENVADESIKDDRNSDDVDCVIEHIKPQRNGEDHVPNDEFQAELKSISGSKYRNDNSNDGSIPEFLSNSVPNTSPQLTNEKSESNLRSIRKSRDVQEKFLPLAYMARRIRDRGGRQRLNLKPIRKLKHSRNVPKNNGMWMYGLPECLLSPKKIRKTVFKMASSQKIRRKAYHHTVFGTLKNRKLCKTRKTQNNYISLRPRNPIHCTKHGLRYSGIFDL